MYAGAINLWRVGLSRQQAHAKCVKGGNMDDGEVKKHYISEITEMISKINDAGTLEYLHTFIKLFLKKWG